MSCELHGVCVGFIIGRESHGRARERYLEVGEGYGCACPGDQYFGLRLFIYRLVEQPWRGDHEYI